MERRLGARGTRCPARLLQNGERLHREALTEGVLRSGVVGIDRFVTRDCLGVCAADRALAAEIMGFHARRVNEATTAIARVRLTRAFLKPLRERAKARGRVDVLAAAPLGPPPMQGTFHKWLAADPGTERQRALPEGGRTQTGVASWPHQWSPGVWGVVCYERAAGRLLAERGSEAPSLATVRGLVHVECLPTAVANPADHYALVGPAGEARYLTVEEVARSFGLASSSSLMKTLRDPGMLTAAQAVGCLGRSVHVGIACLLVRHLMARGLVRPGATYGSAYSGLDCVAAAMEVELGARWSYRFASEREPHIRRALLHAWSERGLRPERCYTDAAAGAATLEEGVDLWAMTPSCEPFSRRNRRRSRATQCASLGEVWASLGYARVAVPRVILVENLAEPEVSEPLTGLLQRLAGYRVETATLDPRTALGEPVARERRFWILWRPEDQPLQARTGAAPSTSRADAQDPSGAAH